MALSARSNTPQYTCGNRFNFPSHKHIGTGKGHTGNDRQITSTSQLCGLIFICKCMFFVLLFFPNHKTWKSPKAYSLDNAKTGKKAFMAELLDPSVIKSKQLMQQSALLLQGK